MDKFTHLGKEVLTIVNSAVVIILLVVLINKDLVSVGDYIAVTMAVAIIINFSNLIEDYIRMLENLNYSVKAKQMKEQIAEKSIIKSAHGKSLLDFMNKLIYPI
ncbi:hypothetical protein D3H35_29240 [Cohnella faecalis]|uniref:Uncharacterized protein n=2 Tax=Cohnella faecalis TaxID=2315694 RepID=A0A398CAZ2_9BACL|nr:hypothetical protein D3H35_29240 [Cohnella faecalis]